MSLQEIKQLSEIEEKRAGEIIAKLLSSWCIPRGKNMETKQDFDFIANHQDYFNAVVSLCGYSGVTVVSATGKEVAYLSGGNAINEMNFKKAESTVILRLLQKYLESRTKVTLSGGYTDITVGDLLQSVNVTRKNNMELKELKRILGIMDRHNFVRLDLKRKADFSVETVVGIMPSLSCLFPYLTIESIDEKLQSYKDETTRKKALDETEPEPDEDEDDDGETED